MPVSPYPGLIPCFTNGNGLGMPGNCIDFLTYSLLILGSRENSSMGSGGDGLRRAALGPSSRRARTHAVVVVGPPG